MATNAPVQLGRVYLTKVQLKALEMALYQAADVINRLKADGPVYTKIAVPPQEVQ